MAKQIQVKVNMPTTAEGLAALDAAVERMNSLVIAGVLNKHPEIPHEAKVRWIESLNGIAPWAGKDGAHGRA